LDFGAATIVIGGGENDAVAIMALERYLVRLGIRNIGIAGVIARAGFIFRKRTRPRLTARTGAPGVSGAAF